MFAGKSFIDNDSTIQDVLPSESYHLFNYKGTSIAYCVGEPSYLGLAEVMQR